MGIEFYILWVIFCNFGHYLVIFVILEFQVIISCFTIVLSFLDIWC
jgi:hypothetical protein